MRGVRIWRLFCYTKHMKFNRFLNQYSQTSTSLTRDIAPVDDPNRLTDQTFSRRQAVDRDRRHVRRYMESKLVKENYEVVQRSVPSSRSSSLDPHLADAPPSDRYERRRRTGETGIQAPQRPASPPSPPKHRFVEPPSRHRPE